MAKIVVDRSKASICLFKCVSEQIECRRRPI